MIYIANLIRISGNFRKKEVNMENYNIDNSTETKVTQYKNFICMSS